MFDAGSMFREARNIYLTQAVCSETVRIANAFLRQISGVYVLITEWSVWLETVCCVVLCCVVFCMSHVACFVLWQPGAAQGSFVSYNHIF
jgi:hypothetical protein